MPEKVSDWLRPADVMRELGLSYTRVRQLQTSGELPSHVIAGLRCSQRSDVARLKAKRERKQAAK